ncbi:MAG: flagellar motor protein MotB [Spirochaetaceae bacterium]|nr:MAG: flagellar motor protein MotB [Spirochaetaceae bacterium]
MAGVKKKERKSEGAADWLLTYGDMTTLLLTFFVLLFTTAEIDGYELRLVLAAFPGLGTFQGGNTLEVGPLAELGNNILQLPSRRVGRSLDEARRQAISLFEPEIRSNRVRVTRDERGLVISLAADSFFRTASAEIDIERSRVVLQNLSDLLQSETVAGRSFRIEGHTDSEPTDPQGPWPNNWHLGADRSLNVLRYLVDFGAPESRFQVMSLGEQQPLFANDTAEGRAYNRRVDVIILSDGNL